MNKYSQIKSINHPISVLALTESDIYRLSSRNVNRADPDKITRRRKILMCWKLVGMDEDGTKYKIVMLFSSDC